MTKIKANEYDNLVLFLNNDKRCDYNDTLKKFGTGQKMYMRDALKEGLDVLALADTDFNLFMMRELIDGLRNGFDLSEYATRGFDIGQIREIKLGLINKINVLLYDKIEYSWQVMKLVREDLENNIDVSIYLNEKYNYNQMSEISRALNNNLDVTDILNENIRSGVMAIIVNRMMKGLDYSVFLKERYTTNQAWVINDYLRYNIDVTPYISVDNTVEEIKEIAWKLFCDIPLEDSIMQHLDVMYMYSLNKDYKKGETVDGVTSMFRLFFDKEECLNDLKGYYKFNYTYYKVKAIKGIKEVPFSKQVMAETVEILDIIGY